MKDPREVIIRPIISESTYMRMEDNVYTFEVAKTANKVEIAQAVEAIFDVKVVKVNTANVKSKPKRVRYQIGKTRTWKKAMVTLAEGDSIEIFAAQDQFFEPWFNSLRGLLRFPQSPHKLRVENL